MHVDAKIHRECPAPVIDELFTRKIQARANAKWPQVLACAAGMLVLGIFLQGQTEARKSSLDRSVDFDDFVGMSRTTRSKSMLAAVELLVRIAYIKFAE